MGRLFASLSTGMGSLYVAGKVLRCRLRSERRRGYCRLAPVTALLSLLSSAACTPTVRLESDFPSPAIDALPLRAAVIYSDEFERYTYRSPRGADAAVVELGPAQLRLLDGMLGAVFAELSRQETWPSDQGISRPDLVLAPSIERFTLHGPAYLGSGYYEVRIAYRLDLYTPAGALVGGLPIEGYGRSPARWSSLSEPVRQATIRAMRDAAVQIVLQLPEQPAIDQLLREKRALDHGQEG